MEVNPSDSDWACRSEWGNETPHRVALQSGRPAQTENVHSCYRLLCSKRQIPMYLFPQEGDTLFSPFFKATPRNSARAGGEGLFLGRTFGKQRNTWCISCFPNCADGGKTRHPAADAFARCCLTIPWESRKFSNKKLPVGKIGKTPPLSPEKYGAVSF